MIRTKFLRWIPLDPISFDKERQPSKDADKMYILYTDLIETVNKIMDLCIYWESYPPWYESKNGVKTKIKKNKTDIKCPVWGVLSKQIKTIFKRLAQGGGGLGPRQSRLAQV